MRLIYSFAAILLVLGVTVSLILGVLKIRKLKDSPYSTIQR